MRARETVVLLAIAALGLAPAIASATTQYTLSNHPQPDEQNVLYRSVQNGLTILGDTNQTNTPVEFASTELLQTTANGQANLSAVDGRINTVTISVPGFTFADLILNPFSSVRGNGTISTAVLVEQPQTRTTPFQYDLGAGEFLDDHGRS